MLRMTIPVESGNKAITDGTLPQVLQKVLGTLKPEAAYFGTNPEGQRSAVIVFDMTDSSTMPATFEPLFMELNASITLSPCMNVEDLQKGLAAMGGK
jgi:hypothetical protein